MDLHCRFGDAHLAGDLFVQKLPPQEAQRRFQLVFRRFIGVFARPEHPLALFLDDLQWLDAATLDLLEDLLTRNDLQHLLLIGAYRDNEVSATHRPCANQKFRNHHPSGNTSEPRTFAVMAVDSGAFSGRISNNKFAEEVVMRKSPDLSRRQFFAGAAATAAASTFGLSNLVLAERSVTMNASVRPGGYKTAIRPFHVNFPEAELTELRRRIKATRWPERETVSDATQGVQLATTQALARYWATDYDWRKVEARLSALPNFVTEIDGLDIHFIHVRSKHANALPLIVTHGWPGEGVSEAHSLQRATHGRALRRVGAAQVHERRNSRRLQVAAFVVERVILIQPARHHRAGPVQGNGP